MRKFIFPLIPLVAAVTVIGCTKIIEVPVKETTYIIEYLEEEEVHSGGDMVSIQTYGVLPSNDAATNTANLQAAIDKVWKDGTALYVTPCKHGYPLNGGIVLRENVSLIGVHGPVSNGTIGEDGEPTGSVFIIEDEEQAFITCNTASQLKGIQFYYPNQVQSSGNIVKYPPTVCNNSGVAVYGVTLSSLTFYGAYQCIKFDGTDTYHVEQILCEYCTGYPLGGSFISIAQCYDIPRILHCTSSPDVVKGLGFTYSKSVQDKVVAANNWAYRIETTDNIQMLDVTAKGNYGGIYLGDATYGQLTNFSLSNVAVGIRKGGNGGLNRAWEIAQGYINVNVGTSYTNNHPFLVEGTGSLTLMNVKSTSESSTELTTQTQGSNEFICFTTTSTPVSATNCEFDRCVTAVTTGGGTAKFVNCLNNGTPYSN